MSNSNPRPAGVGFIFITLVLSIVGFGLLIPVLPDLIQEFQKGSYTSGSYAFEVDRQHLLVDAVHLFADSRRSLRPFWAASHHPHRDGRLGHRLLDHGQRAHADVVLHRTRHRGFHSRNPRHGQRLHRGCDSSREARAIVRVAGCGVWHRLYHRTGLGWFAGPVRYPPAVLVRGGLLGGEFYLGLLHASRVVEAGEPPGVFNGSAPIPVAP